MEAARKTIEVLGQRILPGQPHHLAFHPEWRYRPSHGDSSSFEEWHHPRLQYLTLLSEADRGVLLTKSDYDMREEPAKPLPREVNALAKGGEKKKLSLSDYKNKKTGATSSTSPPEPSIAKKKESERAGDLSASTGAASDHKPTSESKSASEARKADRHRPRESDPLVDAKQRPGREPAADMRWVPFELRAMAALGDDQQANIDTDYLPSLPQSTHYHLDHPLPILRNAWQIQMTICDRKSDPRLTPASTLMTGYRTLAMKRRDAKIESLPQRLTKMRRRIKMTGSPTRPRYPMAEPF